MLVEHIISLCVLLLFGALAADEWFVYFRRKKKHDAERSGRQGMHHYAGPVGGREEYVY